MPRYIDADALKVPFVNWLNANMGTEAMCYLMQEVIDGIDEAPTVDAVEVVRCKDCKHRKNPEECPMCFTEVVDVVGGQMYKFTDLTSDNGYCHMGAKMDGGAK